MLDPRKDKQLIDASVQEIKDLIETKWFDRESLVKTASYIINMTRAWDNAHDSNRSSGDGHSSSGNFLSDKRSH